MNRDEAITQMVIELMTTIPIGPSFGDLLLIQRRMEQVVVNWLSKPPLGIAVIQNPLLDTTVVK